MRNIKLDSKKYLYTPDIKQHKKYLLLSESGRNRLMLIMA